MNPTVASRSALVQDPVVPAGRFAAAGACAVALLIVALHGIKPEFEPSWRFVSEYAIGRHGWIMTIAFLIWAASCAVLALALRREVRTRAGRIGVAILLVVAAALVPAGLFPQDPVTAGPGDATTSGMIHALASMVGIPGIPIAAVLISSSLWRTNPNWAPHRHALGWSAHATWISLSLMVVYLAWAVPNAGGFTREVWAGAMNRLVVATDLGWQLIVARRLVAIGTGRSPA
jgi:Protein of unknown function (DUF998)